MAEIYSAGTGENLDSAAREKLLGLLPLEEQVRIKGYRLLEDQQRAFLGAVLVRSVISSATGLQNKDIVFLRNENGKPCLQGAGGVHFNLSHSGKWVVCIAGSSEVGIDVEEMKPVDISLGEGFFSRSEYEALKKLPQEQQLERFYELWTLKESYVKAVGRGLEIPLNSFSIEIKAGEIELISEAAGDFMFKQYEIDRGYKLAACSKGDALPDRIIKVNESTLFLL
ncbi:phosphopantetheine--protein transferase [Desulfosporosinus orientis DSM 765]|uniref:Phosphopantetheine--protein transferase n=1 Tax=Desulfosporosinus orientis (strain ATCC 19365 / DSM 765 / NCIMB 8382 / VKM B-1628 / Singapore I) TaxID=768706 RepID=G7W6R3_DESOD|nr:4'-phosphopantetheinyl transferase superfamily protein [Desulfosporosinus orientis]AET69195.1 phosphopantetheine--protein transferase [Desulfosporosinus orientis DSM 765]